MEGRRSREPPENQAIATSKREGYGRGGVKGPSSLGNPTPNEWVKGKRYARECEARKEGLELSLRIPS